CFTGLAFFGQKTGDTIIEVARACPIQRLIISAENNIAISEITKDFLKSNAPFIFQAAHEAKKVVIEISQDYYFISPIYRLAKFLNQRTSVT
ncbi:hypothetical protein PENTCL1PPCAC_5222, partial [Pristionchus entomophagus]